MANFSIAFSQGKEESGFIDCKAFGNTALLVKEWLVKGDKVAITGRLREERFQRKDGSQGKALILLADDIEFIDVLKTRTTPEVNAEELPFEPAEEVKPVEKSVAKPARPRR